MCLFYQVISILIQVQKFPWNAVKISKILQYLKTHTVLCLISAPPQISAPLFFFLIAFYKELKEKSEVIKEINAKKAVRISKLLVPISKAPGALIRHNTVYVI